MLNAVRSLKLSVLSSPLPERGVLLGGSLALHGKAVSLACFHGVNFRSQSWVLFTLQRPYVTFSSKVCTVEKSCQVRRVKAVQDLSLRLGHGTEDSVSGKLLPSSGKESRLPLLSLSSRKANTEIRAMMKYVILFNFLLDSILMLLREFTCRSLLGSESVIIYIFHSSRGNHSKSCSRQEEPPFYGQYGTRLA